MNRFLALIMVMAQGCVAYAASPSYDSFDATQFTSSPGSGVRIKSGAAITSPVITGTVTAPSSTGVGITNASGVYSANLAAGANVTLTTGANGQISIAASGGGGASTNVQNLTVADGVIYTPASITTDINWRASRIRTKALSGNTTFTFSNMQDGQFISVVVTNPSTHTLAWPSDIKWMGGTPTQSTSNTDTYDFLYVSVLGYPLGWWSPGTSSPLAIANGGTGATSANGAQDALATSEADVASATTTDLGAVNSQHVRITGTTTITGLGTVAAGVKRWVRFAGALTFTHNATSLILPNAGNNITTAANDRCLAFSLGSGNWFIYIYQKADGTSLVSGGSVSDTAFGSSWNGATTTAPSQNAVYDALIGGIFKTGYITGDQATTSATAVDVTNASFPIGANEVWSVEFNVGITVSGAGGIKFAFDVPAAATVGGGVTGGTVNAVISADDTLTANTTTTSPRAMTCFALIQNGANAGDVKLRFASGDGSVTATIKGGQCYWVARKLN